MYDSSALQLPVPEFAPHSCKLSMSGLVYAHPAAKRGRER